MDRRTVAAVAAAPTSGPGSWASEPIQELDPDDLRRRRAWLSSEQAQPLSAYAQ